MDISKAHSLHSDPTVKADSTIALPAEADPQHQGTLIILILILMYRQHIHCSDRKEEDNNIIDRYGLQG